ncbi:MAG TPA: hypothetical protein VM345_01945 [Acidimicrobiales bacterium]|nr:hypothetical protein [Acidimicrobiales bacterium]
MIPLATTTIKVILPAAVGANVDPLSAAGTATTVAEGVRAHIRVLSGDESTTGAASQSDVRYRLKCDPVVMSARSRVIDESTGLAYEVVWAQPVTAFGLDHVAAELRRVAGLA